MGWHGSGTFAPTMRIGYPEVAAMARAPGLVGGDGAAPGGPGSDGAVTAQAGGRGRTRDLQVR